MKSVVSLIRRYPFVLATLLVALVAGILALSGAQPAVPWLLGGFALVMAARSAWSMVQELRRGTFGIDILAVTAIVTAVIAGEYWAALIIVLMLTGGEALEDYAAGRAKRDLTALLARAPQSAHRLDADGTTTEVPIAEIQPGDHILVRANEVVPADGVLRSEAGVFDDSQLTGESLPVERTAGDEVLSGEVNGVSPVEIVVQRAAADSQYQAIVNLVEQAAASTSPMVRLADRIAVPFTLVALAIAGVAWAVSGQLVRFAEVLVVATPCPLIIAAPVAFMAGMSRSSREGAIVKSSASLEAFHRARTFAFDKTGTLTQGQPSLTDVQVRPGFEKDAVLRLAASAEQTSAHVLAAATRVAARERGLPLSAAEDAREATANGVSATVDGHTVLVGKAAFIGESFGLAEPEIELEPGDIAVHVGIDGRIAGALLFRDRLRDNANATVANIREAGIAHVVMLTGDDAPTANAVAAQVGIQEVRANCLPADKVKAVTSMPHRPVVMVGDGVNDAPVLAAAEVGIAMGARGSTAATESADVVILRDDISRVARAFTVGRETVNVALQSIWAGILLSLTLMVIAAFGILPAIVGAWMQEAVDVVSILWALRAVTGSTDPFTTGTTPRRVAHRPQPQRPQSATVS